MAAELNKPAERCDGNLAAEGEVVLQNGRNSVKIDQKWLIV